MSMSNGHGWGFCEAEVQLPDILFQRIVNAYVSSAYYAGVAMVGQRFPKEKEIISVDAWKLAFQAEDITDAFRFFYCDALPLNHEQIIKDEIRKHPLYNKAPATIPLSSANAKTLWANFSSKFMELEAEVGEWAKANADKLPNAMTNFDIEEWMNEEEDED